MSNAVKKSSYYNIECIREVLIKTIKSNEFSTYIGKTPLDSHKAYCSHILKDVLPDEMILKEIENVFKEIGVRSHKKRLSLISELTSMDQNIHKDCGLLLYPLIAIALRFYNISIYSCSNETGAKFDL